MSLIRAAMTSGTLYLVGDVMNQMIQYSSVDWKQTAKFGLIGFTCHGPYFRYGLNWLERFGTGTSIKTVVLKSFLGQGIVFPPYCALFLAYSALLDGKDPIENIKEKYIPIFMNGWLVWPFANMVNFKLVPRHLRLGFINVVGIGWNSYLSFAAYKS
jgi:protein Mpv17